MLKMKSQNSGELSFSDTVQPETQLSTDACESDISDNMLLSVLHFGQNELDYIFKCADDGREAECLNCFTFRVPSDAGVHVCFREKGRSSRFVHGTAIVKSITQLKAFADLRNCRIWQLADSDSKNLSRQRIIKGTPVYLYKLSDVIQFNPPRHVADDVEMRGRRLFIRFSDLVLANPDEQQISAMNTLNISAEYLLKRSSVEAKIKAAIESYNISIVKVAAVGIPMNIVHSVFNCLHEVLNVSWQKYSTVQYSTVHQYTVTMYSIVHHGIVLCSMLVLFLCLETFGC